MHDSSASASRLILPLEGHHQFRLYSKQDSEGLVSKSEEVNLREDCSHRESAERTLIILPGTRLNHEMPEEALQSILIPSMIQAVGLSLARSGKTPDNVYCAAYSHNNEQMISDHFSRRLARRGRDETYTADTDVYAFVHSALFPLAGIEENDPLPQVDVMRERLSRVTLVGHSFGTVMAAQAAKALRWELTHRGCSQAEAQTICNEVEVIALGNMAKVVPERQDYLNKGFRTHTFAAYCDRTAWDTMLRIARDHHSHGLRTENPANALQAEYYDACGYDAERAPLMQDKQANLPPARHNHLECNEAKNGPRYLADLPDAILSSDALSARPLTLNTDQIRRESELIRKLIVRRTGKETGINGEPLIRENHTPEHDHRMFLMRADDGSNAALVDAVDTALRQAIKREVREVRAHTRSGDGWHQR